MPARRPPGRIAPRRDLSPLPYSPSLRNRNRARRLEAHPPPRAQYFWRNRFSTSLSDSRSAHDPSTSTRQRERRVPSWGAQAEAGTHAPVAGADPHLSRRQPLISTPATPTSSRPMRSRRDRRRHGGYDRFPHRRSCCDALPRSIRSRARHDLSTRSIDMTGSATALQSRRSGALRLPLWFTRHCEYLSPATRTLKAMWSARRARNKPPPRTADNRATSHTATVSRYGRTGGRCGDDVVGRALKSPGRRGRRARARVGDSGRSRHAVARWIRRFATGTPLGSAGRPGRDRTVVIAGQENRA